MVVINIITEKDYLNQNLARQDAAEKVLKDLFFEKMAAKSKTCTCGQSDTLANSSVDKNKKKIERLMAYKTP